MSRPAVPVCVRHGTEMRARKNNARILLNASFGPYEIWMADIYECREGGEEIISGWAQRALAMHFEDGFAAELERGFDVEVKEQS